MAEASDLIQVTHKNSPGAVATVSREAFEELWKHKGFTEAKPEDAPKIYEVGPEVETSKKSDAASTAKGGQS